MPDEERILPHRSWPEKFRDAFRGVRRELAGPSSFRVHFLTAAAVIVCGVLFKVSLIEWCVLLVCITGVFIAEMFNTAMEVMAKAITTERNRQLGIALDVASAAVLMASIGAAIVGVIIFVNRLGLLVGWW